MPISSSMNHDQKWFLSFNPNILKPLYHSSDDKHFTGYLFPRQSRRKWVRYIDRRTRAGPRPGLWQGGLQVTFKQTPAQYCQVRPPPAARPPSLGRRSGSIPGPSRYFTAEMSTMTSFIIHAHACYWYSEQGVLSLSFVEHWARMLSLLSSNAM